MGTYSQNDLENILNYYIKKNTFKSFCDDNNLKATLSNDVYIFEVEK